MFMKHKQEGGLKLEEAPPKDYPAKRHVDSATLRGGRDFKI
jgi:hypothetical protein